MSDDMAIEYLHRSSPENIKQRELKFIKEQRKQEQALAGRDPNAVPTDEELAALGEELGGNENNAHNEETEKVDISDVKEDNGVPELGNYEEIHG